MGDPIPDGEALLQAAVRHRQSGQLGEARRLLERLLQLEPGNHRALHHLGIVLVLQGEAEPGIELIRRALAIFPNFPAALSNLGGLLLNLGRAAEALAELDKAVAIRPDFAEALYNRGSALQMLDRNEEAVEALDRTIAVKPDAEAYWLRGSVLHKLNRTDEALASLDQALALRPHYPEAEIARCMAELPILYEDESELSSRRSAYEQRLRALVRSAGTAANPSDYVKAISITPPFFLAYQGRNDRELQALYGSFVCAIMARSFPPAPLPPPPMDGEPVRVGIVSGCFKRHSNWKMPIKGWLSQLDRRRFRVFAYFTGTGEDDVTSEARGLCDRFVQGGGDSVAWWRSEILADAPHVLVYPEIGMNPIAYALAAMRLAPVQCNSWGHPNTSGFPTLDYYLSSDLMEPPDGQDHYTERLVRLPNLSVYCEPIERPPPTHPSMFNVPPSATVYWCCQSLFKYLPAHDDIFARIAREAGDCRFVFIEFRGGTSVTHLFRRRLDRAFSALGLGADRYCLFLPRLGETEFLKATGHCHIFLDSIGWSGCNSTIESLAYDLPIVTMAGPLMRGRHSAAILQRMGVTETVAETVEEYVAIAARLARDGPWRAGVSRKIAANKHKIYRDADCIAALEEFLDRAARHPPAAG